jgi:hypothetical protein
MLCAGLLLEAPKQALNLGERNKLFSKGPEPRSTQTAIPYCKIQPSQYCASCSLSRPQARSLLAMGTEILLLLYLLQSTPHTRPPSLHSHTGLINVTFPLICSGYILQTKVKICGLTKEFLWIRKLSPLKEAIKIGKLNHP